jgi:CRISPR system Cascade subunit CasE
VTAPLSLVRLKPDLAALAAWAVPRGYMGGRRDGVDDPGYALHAALKAALGAAAPRPFLLRDRERTPELLGYVVAEPAAVEEAAAVAAALGTVPAPVLNLAEIEARAMPLRWTEGRHWSFETRIRPVVRSRSGGRDSPAAEIDVAFWRARQADAAAAPSREDAYRAWFADRLAVRGAARLIAVEVTAMRSSFVLRRPVIDGERRAQRLPGPDVALKGEIAVGDPAAFAALVAGGVGRHRAFGFGCLLLAPPGVW